MLLPSKPRVLRFHVMNESTMMMAIMTRKTIILRRRWKARLTSDDDGINCKDDDHGVTGKRSNLYTMERSRSWGGALRDETKNGYVGD